VEPSKSPELKSDNRLTFTAGGFIYRNVEERLPGKPLEILKALFQAPRRELTRNDLLKKCWPEGNAVENSTISNHVSDARKALRRAMDKAGTKPPQDARKDYPIVTVNRGGGDGANDRTAWRLEELP
jgi:DNA-binding winged helix-turn-helix (wHTH) protein